MRHSSSSRAAALRKRLGATRLIRFQRRIQQLWQDREMARRRPHGAWRYLLHSRETTNFTYELANEVTLADFVAQGLDRDRVLIAQYLTELRSDHELMASLRARLAGAPRHNNEPMLGKRRALYCIVRAERPRVIVESGIDAGLGSAVLLRALERNAEEGSGGRLFAFDINPEAGWLIDRDLHADRLELRIGDTRETLEDMIRRTGVDFFIHDSLKTYEHESFELESAIRHSRGRLVLYTDDVSATGALLDVCPRHGGRTETVKEVPLDHYYEGNELGLCLLDR